MRKTLFLAMVCMGTALAAGAETPWPPELAANAPAASRSPQAIHFPADVKLASLGTGGIARAGWDGGWRGWACRGFECDVGLVVEEIRGDEATVVFAIASEGLDYSQRLRARFQGTELHFSLGDRGTVALRMRPDRHLDLLWQRRTDWVGGVLVRDDSTAQERTLAAEQWLARAAIDVQMTHPLQTYTIRVHPPRRASDFLAWAGDECLGRAVPTQLRFEDPYIVMVFTPGLRGCDFQVEYRAHPVTGRAWAYRSDDEGESWRDITGKAEMKLRR